MVKAKNLGTHPESPYGPGEYVVVLGAQSHKS